MKGTPDSVPLLCAEIERLRKELAHAMRPKAPERSAVDEQIRLKATWWDVLSQSCNARNIKDPMFLLDEYDRIYGA